jgi:hypothetical protein
LDRALDRVRHAEAEFDRFAGYCNMADPKDERTFLKLRADVDAAQRDVSWFQHQLDACLAVAGVDL